MVKISDKTRQLAFELAALDKRYIELHAKFRESLYADNGCDKDVLLIVPPEPRRTIISIYPFNKQLRGQVTPCTIANGFADCNSVVAEICDIDNTKTIHCHYLIDGHPCLSILDA